VAMDGVRSPGRGPKSRRAAVQAERAAALAVRRDAALSRDQANLAAIAALRREGAAARNSLRRDDAERRRLNASRGSSLASSLSGSLTASPARPSPGVDRSTPSPDYVTDRADSTAGSAPMEDDATPPLCDVTPAPAAAPPTADISANVPATAAATGDTRAQPAEFAAPPAPADATEAVPHTLGTTATRTASPEVAATNREPTPPAADARDAPEDGVPARVARAPAIDDEPTASVEPAAPPGVVRRLGAAGWEVVAAPARWLRGQPLGGEASSAVPAAAPPVGDPPRPAGSWLRPWTWRAAPVGASVVAPATAPPA